LKAECERVAIHFEEKIERNIWRSRKALGQIRFPEKLYEDVILVKQEDFEEESKAKHEPKNEPKGETQTET